ncbi:hypothetical protein [Sneathiella limimaris]|uniref:hypothetical protein n=1 Tax=Sneathiella limimaris TaxID=1964213 RepID=UPI00146CD907|nr:hypothetical protein [Sneathiella limimaris]
MKQPEKIDTTVDFTKATAYQQTIKKPATTEEWMAVMKAGNEAFLASDIPLARLKFQQAANLAEGMMAFALTYDVIPDQAIICLEQSYQNSSEVCFRTGQFAEGVAVLHARLDRLGHYALIQNLSASVRAELLSRLDLALETLSQLMFELGYRPDDIDAIRQVVASIQKQGIQLMGAEEKNV